MEPADPKGLRHRLILGKFPVTKVSPGALGIKFAIAMGSGVTLTIDAPVTADVRLGDLLTLYTEVLHASPERPSVQ